MRNYRQVGKLSEGYGICKYVKMKGACLWNSRDIYMNVCDHTCSQITL